MRQGNFFSVGFCNSLHSKAKSCFEACRKKQHVLQPLQLDAYFSWKQTATAEDFWSVPRKCLTI